MAISIPLVYLMLPETKDVSLEEIQKYFKPNKSIFRVGISSLNREITVSCLNKWYFQNQEFLFFDLLQIMKISQFRYT